MAGYVQAGEGVEVAYGAVDGARHAVFFAEVLQIKAGYPPAGDGHAFPVFNQTLRSRACAPSPHEIAAAQVAVGCRAAPVLIHGYQGFAVFHQIVVCARHSGVVGGVHESAVGAAGAAEGQDVAHAHPHRPRVGGSAGGGVGHSYVHSAGGVGGSYLIGAARSGDAGDPRPLGKGRNRGRAARNREVPV